MAHSCFIVAIFFEPEDAILALITERAVQIILGAIHVPVEMARSANLVSYSSKEQQAEEIEQLLAMACCAWNTQKVIHTFHTHCIYPCLYLATPCTIQTLGSVPFVKCLLLLVLCSGLSIVTYCEKNGCHLQALSMYCMLTSSAVKKQSIA